jgi:hypothetical protein
LINGIKDAPRPHSHQTEDGQSGKVICMNMIGISVTGALSDWQSVAQSFFR